MSEAMSDERINEIREKIRRHYSFDCDFEPASYDEATELIAEVGRLRTVVAEQQRQLDAGPKWCRVPTATGRYVRFSSWSENPVLIGVTRTPNFIKNPRIAYYGPLPASVPESMTTPDKGQA